MYAISILLKNSALVQTFYFDHFANADELYKNTISFQDTNVIVEDEYNSKGFFISSEISGVSFTDIKRDMDKQGAMELMRQKAFMRAQKTAQHDSGLNFMSGIKGPQIINGN